MSSLNGPLVICGCFSKQLFPCKRLVSFGLGPYVDPVLPFNTIVGNQVFLPVGFPCLPILATGRAPFFTLQSDTIHGHPPISAPSFEPLQFQNIALFQPSTLSALERRHTYMFHIGVQTRAPRDAWPWFFLQQPQAAHSRPQQQVQQHSSPTGRLFFFKVLGTPAEEKLKKVSKQR